MKFLMFWVPPLVQTTDGVSDLLISIVFWTLLFQIPPSPQTNTSALPGARYLSFSHPMADFPTLFPTFYLS